MAEVYQIVVWDFSGNEINLTSRWHQDAGTTVLNKQTGVKKSGDQIPLHFPTYEYEDLVGSIKGKMKVAAGWRDDVTDEWISDDDHDLWGGYVRSMVYTGTNGNEIYYSLLLDTFEVLLKTTIVPGYPDNPYDGRLFHRPAVPSEDIPITGYKPGFTPRQWLVGDKDDPLPGALPWDGVVRMYLGNDVDYSGVMPATAMVVFDHTGRPSNTAVLGHMEGLFLWEAIELILGYWAIIYQARFHEELDFHYLRPVYFMRAIPHTSDPTKIMPQFCVTDLADAEAAEMTFTDQPLGLSTERTSWWGYTTETDSDLIAQRVLVIGKGAVFAGFDEFVKKLYKRVYYEDVRYVGDDPPTEHQTYPGWATIIVDESIVDQEGATGLARQVADLLHDAQENGRFFTYHPVQQGQIIRIRHQKSQGEFSTGKNYAVLDVDTYFEEGGNIVYTVKVGWDKPTQTDLLNGPTGTLLQMAAMGIKPNRAGAGPNFSNPNHPANDLLQALYTVSSSRFQNIVQSRSDMHPAWQMRASANRSGMTPDGEIIDPEVDEDDLPLYLVNAPIANPPLRPTPGEDILPQPMFPVWNSDGEMVQWYDAEGKDHPQEHLFVFFADDSYPIVFPAPVILSTVRINAEWDGTTLVYGEKEDPPGTFTWTGTTDAEIEIVRWDWTTMTDVVVSPAVDPDHPLYLGRGNYAQIRCTNVGPGRKVEVLVSEANPHPDLYRFEDEV